MKINISTYLYYRYEECNEGFMTRLQIKFEDKKTLAQLSKVLGLEKYFIISKQIEYENGRELEKLHEDIFESFLGALYLCNGITEGLNMCFILVSNLLEKI